MVLLVKSMATDIPDTNSESTNLFPDSELHNYLVQHKNVILLLL